jgi:hypothetical protein
MMSSIYVRLNKLQITLPVLAGSVEQTNDEN